MENWRRRANPKVSKPFYKSIKKTSRNRFVSSFLAADILHHKLNHPVLKSLFAALGKVLPSETALRACVAKSASQKQEQSQELLRDKTFFLIVDEAEVAKQKYNNVLVGSLDAPNQAFLVDYHPLDSGIAMSIALLFCTLWMTYCENLK